MSKTLDQILTQIRRRLGWPDKDAFVSDAELSDMIRASQQELLDLLVSIHQGDYRSAQAAFITKPGSQAYVISPNPASTLGVPDLLADFARIQRVSFLVDNASVPMRRWEVENDVHTIEPQPWEPWTDVRYRITSGLTAENEKVLWFNPTPTGVYTVLVWGIEGLTNVTFSATDAINALANDEYLVLDGMIKCLQMEESDTSLVERQKARFIEMITNNATPIDAGQAATIRDVRGAEREWDRFRWRW